MARSFATSRGFATGRGFRVNGQVGGGGGNPTPDPAPQFTQGPTLYETETETSLRITFSSDQAVQGWLEYGLTTSYGSETTHETSYITTHVQTISGLTAGTTYHVRAHIVNGDGLETVSSDATFRTADAPPADYPAWVTTLQSELTPLSVGPAITLTPGTYTGTQFTTWLASTVGNGTSAVWKNAVAQNCTINLSGSGAPVDFGGRSYIQLDLTGTTINNQMTSTNSMSAALVFRNGAHHIRVVNGTVNGHHPAMETPGSTGVIGHQCGFTAMGQSHHIEIDSMRFEGIRGFGWFLTSLNGSANPPGSGWIEDVWVHDCYLQGAEQAWAIIAARRVLGQRNEMVSIHGSVYDFESEYYQNGSDYFFSEDNIIDGYGWECTGNNFECRYLNANPNNVDISTGPYAGTSLLGSSGVAYNNVTIRNDHIIRGEYRGRGGLLIRASKSNPKSNWLLENIHSDAASSLTTISAFNAMTNLTIRDCKQFIVGGGTIYTHSSSDGGNVPDVNVVETGSTT